jgi:predicted transcriptional regulator
MRKLLMQNNEKTVCLPLCLILSLTRVELGTLAAITANMPPGSWKIITNAELANTVGIDQSRIPRTLQKLENLGLIERRVTHAPGRSYVKEMKRVDFA